MTIERYDMVVVGAGPAGLTAAGIALKEGARVALIDDNPRPGGQIWRQGPRALLAAPLKVWLDEYERHPRLTHFSGARVIARSGETRVLIESVAGALHVEYGSLILATGARERLLPFHGWTLPGVTGAGGLQALIKGGMAVKGERVVIAGSGPLLLAAAASAIENGADVIGVFEQADFAGTLRFGAGLLAMPSKLAQAVKLLRVLNPGRYRTGAVVSAVRGNARVEAAVVRTRRGDEEIACDRVAVGYGLVPNITLAQALGCETTHAGIVVNPDQRTSVAGIYAAGECTGIGGMELSRAEGALAAFAALGIDDGRTFAHNRARARWRRFAARLDRAFALTDRALARPPDATIFCRCEDVTFGAVAAHSSWRDAKLHTRCGMGACQGRVCGAAALACFGWDSGVARPPFSPARIETLMTACNTTAVDGHFDVEASPL